MSCQHWVGGAYCGAADTRMYLPGMRCPVHTPAALAGRPEDTPDPDRTLEGARRLGVAQPYRYRPTDSSVVDARAVASGRRRSNDRTYRLAQQATQKH